MQEKKGDIVGWFIPYQHQQRVKVWMHVTYWEPSEAVRICGGGGVSHVVCVHLSPVEGSVTADL